MDLFEFNNLVRENFYEIAKARYPKDEITSRDIIRFFDLDINKPLHEFLIKNIPILNCLIPVEKKYDTYTLFKYESEYNKEYVSSPEFDPNLCLKSLTPSKLINVDVPLLNPNEFMDDKTLYIHKTESFTCKECKYFEELLNKCNYRHIKVKEYYPACMFIIFKKNKK